MTVEDALEAIASHFKLEQSSTFDLMVAFGVIDGQTWETRFVINTVKHVREKRPLSTEQAKIVLKIATRLEDVLIEEGLVAPNHIARLVANPIYRIQPYQSSNIPREVRYLGANLLGLRFKYNDIIIEDIKKLNRRNQELPKVMPWFHREYRIWVIGVNRDCLDAIETLIATHRFQFDEDVVAYLAKCHASKDEISEFVMDDELGVIAANVCDNELLTWWISVMIAGEEV